MKPFKSILIVKLILVITILIQSINGKCIMRGVCSSHKEQTIYENPLDTKWFNCQYDAEPLPLENQQAVADFKKLCAPLYTDDSQPLCCNSEQLTILKKDLLTAQALIGSCSSCYFNFRMLWCQFACSPNQDDFLIPVNITERKHSNFTQRLAQYRLEQSKTGDYEDYEYDYNEKSYYDDEQDSNDVNENDDQHYNDEEEERTSSGTTNNYPQTSNTTGDNSAVTTLSEMDDYYHSGYDDENEYNDEDENLKNDRIKKHINRYKTIKRIKKSSDEHEHPMFPIVARVEYFISRIFMESFVDSCRDIKLYGNDALQGLCKYSAKECSGQRLGNYLGLEVKMRPMDIQFNLMDEAHLKYKTKSPSGEAVTYDIKTKTPHYHMCNESFEYGDLEYGAKCSCKDCQNSCQLFEDLKITKKQVFMMGELDGVSVIMTILWFLFLIPFFKSISLFKNLRKKFCQKKSTALNCTVYGSPNGTHKKENMTENFENNLISPEQADFTMSPVSGEEDEINQRRSRRLDFLDRMKYVGGLLEKFIEEKFTRMGHFCATYPGLVLFIGIGFCSVLCFGYLNFKIENDPIKLWSADSSDARQNKKYFDEHFDPFYRITQLIIEPKIRMKPIFYEGKNLSISSLNAQLLSETFELYNKINSLEVTCTDCSDKPNQKIKLEDICFQPLKPNNKECATQSIFQYYQNDINKIRSSISKQPDSTKHFYHLKNCMVNPYNADCLGGFGGPIQPYMIAGSYKDNNFLEAKSLVITYVINNYIKEKRPDDIKRAMAWEFEVLNILKNYSSPFINVIYTTERSIEDELERESKADMKIIGISYVVMFFYLTLTLGKYSSMNIRVILIEMKIFLALSGVILVILSVLSSGGFFMYLGVPATLITLEVIPFLLLAVGIDNIYVMVQTYQNDERRPKETVEDQIARIVGKVGPSMLLTGTTQSSAFLISSMTPMPGVRAFSLYASLAIVLNFILQITCFVALLTIDAKREKAKRIDMLCCIKCRNLDDSEINNGKKSFLHMWFKEIYTPFILNNCVRAVIIMTFVGFFFACIAMCDKIKIGLDQKLTMSQDSYQNKYFGALQEHLKVGPPVYFILKDGYNYTDVNKLRLLCGASNCDANSLQSIISSASFFPNETYIAQSPVNWIDDYMEWLNADPFASTSSHCCHINSVTNEFCDVKKLSHFEYQKTEEEKNFLKHCYSCPVNRTHYQFPTNEVVLGHIDSYLKQNPGPTCIKAGHAMYGAAVNLERDEKTHKVTKIGSSHFMAYHTVLSTSNDFINAMVSANQISEKITKILNSNNNGSASDTNYEVIPYSIFYVFYEQYVKIWQDATAQLCTTLIAIFICTFILLSFDLFTALIVTVVVAIIIIDMVGIMFLWDIELNAISLVNLVIAIGISVEFSAHIARAFATSNGKTKKKRASDALCNMGPPVFSGVLQSIVGISVLAFAHSQLFQVFYFRMYFSILLLGLTHGLIFLPVLLSYIGPNEKFKTFIGRSSNHLQYFKVNFDKNSSTESYDNPQEMVAKYKEEILIAACGSSKKLNSPNHKKKSFSKINRKHDRDSSPISRKSVDCLLSNEQNEVISNSSNNSEHFEQETNVDVDDRNNEQHSHRGSLASKLNSFRHKFNGKSRSRKSSNNDFPHIDKGKSDINLNSDTYKNAIKDDSNYAKMLSSTEIEDAIIIENKIYVTHKTERAVPNDTCSDISTPNISMTDDHSNKKSDNVTKTLTDVNGNNLNQSQFK